MGEELDQDIILENVDSGLDIEQPQETIEDGSQETVDEVSVDSENTSVWGEEEIAQPIQVETTQESNEEQTTESDIQSVNESSDDSSVSETDSGESQEVIQDT